MAATEVSISSNALLRLGGKAISSFDEASASGANLDQVRLASNLWPTVRQQVLRSHSWNCATKRVLLSPDVAAPAFGFTHQFLLPSDWLKTIAVGSDDTDRSFAWRSEGRKFLSNEPAFPLVYIFDNTNVGTWDSLLIAATEIAMAMAMCYAVTKSTSLKAELMDEMKMVMQQARTSDAQDDPGEILGDYPLLQSRIGGYWPMGVPQ